VAWLLTRTRFVGRTLFDAFVHLPLVLPPVATGYVLLLLFGNRGPLGRFFHEELGVEFAFTKAGAALATAVMTFPLMVRTIRIALEGVDRGLEAAARTLGAGPFDRFATITLPLMAPGILAGAVTAFSAALGEFGAVITFVSNIPRAPRALAVGALVLSVSLRKRRDGFALQVAFEAPTPGVVALFGRSGCGKSTTIDLIAGLLDPDEGHVRLDDVTLVSTRERLSLPAERRRIGYVFQDSKLFPHFSVGGNLRYGLKRILDGGERIGFDEVVALLGLAPFLARRPH